AARRATCNNNLKQMGLPRHNYHESHKVLPPGSTDNHSTTFWFFTLPFTDEANKYNQLITALAGHTLFNTYAHIPFANAMHNYAPNYMICPSSPYTPFQGYAVGGAAQNPTNFASPMYVGITGGTNAGALYVVTETRGILSGAGVLPPDGDIRIDDIKD